MFAVHNLKLELFRFQILQIIPWIYAFFSSLSPARPNGLLLVLSGTIWDYLGLNRTISDYLRLFRTILEYLGLSGSIWDYLGLSGLSETI